MINMLMKLMTLGSIFIILIMSMSGCTNILSEKLEPKYAYIQSYPGGGGIFLISLTDNASPEENISIHMIADPELQAQLTTTIFSHTNPVGELTIRPTENISEGISKIYLVLDNETIPKGVTLEVEVFNIKYDEPSRYIIEKRNEILRWLSSIHPEYENITNQTWFAYRTYSEILVVEHWTFLSPEYELRICCHITIEPYNWSKMMLRYREDIDPVIAAHQGYDGAIHEINTSDYPIMYGY